MSKKLKKWQVIEKSNTLAIERHKEATRHLINQKNEEIKKLKETIEGMKELDCIKDGVIQMFLERKVFGKRISKLKLSLAIKSPRKVKITTGRKNYRIKLE